MTDKARRHNEFAEALRNVLAELGREGTGRIDRSRVEELGQRFGVDRDEARRIFLDSKGTIWEGELVGTDEEAGWEAAALKHVPPAGPRPEDGI